MKNLFKIIIIILLIQQINVCQNNSIAGLVSGEKPLQNVNISIMELNLSTTSNAKGEFIFKNIPEGEYNLFFSHIGYKKQLRLVQVDNNQSYYFNIKLIENIIQLGEAKVVSSRTEEIFKDISLPLEFIDKKKLNNSVSITISDLLKNEAGLSAVKDGPWGTAINVRGLSKQNLVYLLDGNRIETSTNIAAGLSLIDINDLESIEVVKGGLSSLYGTGATGGVINIRSKTANFSDRRYVKSQFISGFNSVNNGYSNYLNLKAGDRNWSAKLNGSFRKAGDTKIPNGVLENSSFKDESWNASVNYAPVENMIVKISYQKFSAFDVGIPGGAPFPKSAAAKYNYANRQMFDASVQYNNISENLIKTSIKYYNQVISRSVEIKPNPKITVNPKADHTTNGLLFQSDWYLDANNYLITGIDYWQREYNGIRTVNNLIKNVISVDKPVPDSKFSSLGIFAKDEIKLSNSLRVALSGRYDFINILNKQTKNPVYVIVNGERNDNVKNELASYAKYNSQNKSISGSIGTVYKIINNYDFVFNLGYNFRSPSLEERYQYIDLGGLVYLGNPNLKPEKGTFADAGFRIWKENLSLRFSTFYNTFSNLVIDDILYPDSIYIKDNIGSARLYGFDASIDYNFYDEYLVYVRASYVKGDDLTENTPLPQIPPLNGVLGLTIPIKNIVKVDLSSTLASNQENTGLGENRTGGYTYFDISLISNSINIGFGSFNIIAGVQNIFNKKYREHLSTYRGINVAEPGRNIFVKFILNFE